MVIRSLATLLGPMFVWLLALSPAEAQTANARACITFMNKASIKLAAAALAEAPRCMSLTTKGGLPAGMGAQECLSADLRGRIDAASTRVSSADAARCMPAPDFGYAGAAAAIAAGRGLALDLTADLFGSDLATPIASLPCQTRVSTNAAKLANAQLREFLTCKKSGLADGSINDSASLAACLGAIDADGRGRIARERTHLATDDGRFCGPQDRGALFPGYCAFADDFLPCVEVRARCRVCEALNRTDNLANDCETFDDGLSNGSCGPCQPDPDGRCCNTTERDACGFCGGTGFRCGWAEISVAPTHACGRRTDGSLSCWGPNWGGELDAPPGTYTQVVSGGSHAEATNKGHSCALRPDQTVTCWGRNDYGQASPPVGPFVQLAAGAYHTCGLRPDSSITCWGGNTYGETASPAGNTFVRISASRYSNCALRADGELECWGFNYYGNATPLAGPFIDVDAAAIESYGTRPDQTVVRWGEPSPQFDPPPGTYVEIDGGVTSGCGRRPDNSLVCWPDASYEAAITAPPGTYVQMDAGERIYCAIRSDAMLICWGDLYTQSGPPPK